ncbi:hypothetical protein HZA38_05700 [Candidatus Peregrinibacteria bacterium]|nr:hypothetical protein [Candidatus Peregrinibacteria bacterium]
MKFKEILKITGAPIILASLCCLSPVLLVLLGVSTVSFASSLADTLYGEYKWIFRGIGILFLLIFLISYFWKKEKICNLSEAIRKRNVILNTILITGILGVVGYIFFLYVVVHYTGVWLDLWK